MGDGGCLMVDGWWLMVDTYLLVSKYQPSTTHKPLPRIRRRGIICWDIIAEVKKRNGLELIIDGWW